jgi:hypothetical protein
VRGDAIGEARCDFILGEFGPSLGCGGRDQMHRVLVTTHDAGRWRDIVGDDPIATLFGSLGLCVGDDVLGLSGKADDEPRALRFARAQRV